MLRDAAGEATRTGGVTWVINVIGLVGFFLFFFFLGKRGEEDPATMAATMTQQQLSQKEADIQMMLAASCHLGTKNCNHQMERYIYRRRNDGKQTKAPSKPWQAAIQIFGLFASFGEGNGVAPERATNWALGCDSVRSTPGLSALLFPRVKDMREGGREFFG